VHLSKCPTIPISSCHNSHSGASQQVLTDVEVSSVLKDRVIVIDFYHLDMSDKESCIFCVVNSNC